MKLFKELQRRNVIRVAIGYIVSSWLLLQIADLVLDIIGPPDWVLRTIALIFALGFPVVVFFSWAYEVTPEGIKRESEVDRSQSITHVTGRKLDYSIFAVLVLALGYFIWESRYSDKAHEVAEPPSMETVVEDPAITADALSIAVLPFENRSNREEDQFFTDGIHDDLLTTIAKIGSMKVISRTSVMEYKNTTKKLPQIAEELGVANILEGGIQRSGSQVRINVQLIDAQTDEHLWAEIFDRELTAENLFAIQSEITRAIADALQTTLSLEEESRINAMPTQNLAAFEAFQRGKMLMATREAENLKEAAKEFKSAVELDPGFAEAWARIAENQILQTWYGTLEWEEAYRTATDAIQRALDIDANLGYAYAVKVLINRHRNEPEEAENNYLKAIKVDPNNAIFHMWYANVLDRFPLRIQEQISLLTNALALDPRSAIIHTNLGEAYLQKGHYSQAEAEYKKVLEIHPDYVLALDSLSSLYQQNGQIAQSIKYIRQAGAMDTGNPIYVWRQRDLYFRLGEIEKARELQNRLEILDPENMENGWFAFHSNALEGNKLAVREAINWTLARERNRGGNLYWIAWWELWLGNYMGARELFLESDPGWENPEHWQRLIEKTQNNACTYAWIMAQTGDPELAEQLVAQSLRYLRVDLPAAIEHADRYQTDLCFLVRGDVESVVAEQEVRLSHRHLDWLLSPEWPWSALLNHHPKHQQLKAENDRLLEEQRQLTIQLDQGVEL